MASQSPPDRLSGTPTSFTTHCVNEEGLEVLGFRPQLQGPGDLAFQDLVDRVHVVQVGPFREQQLTPASKEALWGSRQPSEQRPGQAALPKPAPLIGAARGWTDALQNTEGPSRSVLGAQPDPGSVPARSSFR